VRAFPQVTEASAKKTGDSKDPSQSKPRRVKRKINSFPNDDVQANVDGGDEGSSANPHADALKPSRGRTLKFGGEKRATNAIHKSEGTKSATKKSSGGASGKKDSAVTNMVYMCYASTCTKFNFTG